MSPIEYAYSAKWSLKVECNYIFLDTKEFDFDVGSVETIDIRQDLQTLKFGVNYRY
jgi:hypothetical protein